MGRNLHKQESHLTLKNHSPGCMWGLFHHLQQNRWHKVVKRLPRARLVYGKHSATGQEREKSSSNDEEIEQDIVEPSVAKSNVEAKHTDHKMGHKGSMRSKLKAFTEEVYKKKGRHRRSTSYPVRKPPDDENLSSHQTGKSIDHALPPTLVEGSTSTAHPDSSQNMRLNYLKQHEVDQLGKEPVRDHTLLHGNLMYAIEPSKGDSLQESKLFMNALNLLNVREEMFMQILKDPSISLANQLHCRRSPNLRYGLNKSLSFSASAPSYARDLDLDSSRKKKETVCVKIEEKGTEDHETNEHLLKESEVSDIPSPSSAKILRKNERVGLMHFKNIREKIKYVIRDRKKEKNRIMMDALHHKVPYGASASKKMAEDAGQARSEFGRSLTRDYKRTTSFDNALDRYNQLIDVTSSKEAKNHTSDESKLSVQPAIRKKPAVLGRIHSLPDIRTHIDVESDSTNEEKPLDRVDNEDKVATNSVPENENQEKIIDLSEALDESVDAKVQESGSSHDSKDESETSLTPVPLKSEDDHKDEDVQELQASISDDSRFSERPQIDTHESEEKLDSFNQQEEKEKEKEKEKEAEVEEKGAEEEDKAVQEKEVPEKEVEVEEKGAVEKEKEVEEQGAEEKEDEEQQEEQHLDTLYEPQDMIDLHSEESELGEYDTRVPPQDAVGIVEESQIQEFYSELLRVQGDEKNNAEFKYVRGVLELSGFSKNESIGQWHSTEYQVNPSVLEEVGGWSIDEHDYCSPNQEDGICNQLLLFDLINEVLLVIHERSFCYWPTPLTSRSRIHPLPKGSRVLEEVWAEIRWLLSSTPESDQATDDAVSRDLAKNDGWMNLQLDAECVGLELEELILDDLVQEIFAD